nr:ribonuclease H-like domain-containing protein [Tanacetum cinerariifolium]
SSGSRSGDFEKLGFVRFWGFSILGSDCCLEADLGVDSVESVGECLFVSVAYCSVWAEIKEAYDKLNGSIIFNLLQKVHSFKQGELTVSEYYHKLNSLWREFDIMTTLSKCSCVARKDVLKHNRLMKFMQILICLNDVFQPIRCSLLSRETLPDVKDAFAIISKEESHRGIVSSSSFSFSCSVSKPQVCGFMSKTNNWTNNRNKKVDNKKYGNTVNTGNNKGPNPNFLFKNYGKVGHSIDRCFDLIGYPLGYNKNFGPKQNGFKSFNANTASTSNENGIH